MNISQSVKLAGIILAIVLGYFLLRGMFSGGGGEAQGEETPEERFTVVVQTISPQEFRDEIVIHGRTEAIRKITVRAETSGVVAETPATLGAFVDEGDVLCRLKVDARRAQLNEARAGLSKARLDHNAAKKLFEDGFRSETGVAAAKAALDQAAANVERANVELAKTDIRAPFAGVFDHRNVEAGDFLNVGEPCGVVIQRSPYLITGSVSEREVAKISKGDRGVAHLATGETIEGVVRFVGSSAHAMTRTFDVELQVPNEDGALRDGVTAEFKIFAALRKAHRIPHSALTLGDEGAIGLRILDGDNRVRFANVALLGEDKDGVWVRGLDGEVRLIVRGQDFVAAGQIVDVAPNVASPEGAGS